MEFEGTSSCFAHIWLSEGLSLERLTIQGGCWMVCGDEVAGQLNAGLSLCHTHTHTHMLCVPRESCGTRQEWCLRLRCSRWAPHRWIYETLCCLLGLRWGGGRGCDKRASLLSIIRGGAGTHSSHVGLTWGQGYIKGIECPCSVWAAVLGWRQRRGVEGDNNQGVQCQVTGEV